MLWWLESFAYFALTFSGGFIVGCIWAGRPANPPEEQPKSSTRVAPAEAVERRTIH